MAVQSMPEGALNPLKQSQHIAASLRRKLLNLFHFVEGEKFLFNVDSSVLLVANWMENFPQESTPARRYYVL